MTRKSRREIEHVLEDIGNDDDTVTIDEVHVLAPMNDGDGWYNPVTGETYDEKPEADAVADFSDTQT